MQGIRRRLAVTIAVVAVLLVGLAPAPAGAADGPRSPDPTLVPSEVATAADAFSFGVAGGVFCDGTGAQGWRVSTFVVEAGANLEDLEFTGAGPLPGYIGDDFDSSADGTVAAPLHKGTDAGINFLPATTPFGQINPSDLAGYTFDPSFWTLANGDYQIGFACTGPTNELRHWWSITVTVDSSASPFLVTATTPSTTTTTQGPTTTTTQATTTTTTPGPTTTTTTTTTTGSFASTSTTASGVSSSGSSAPGSSTSGSFTTTSDTGGGGSPLPTTGAGLTYAAVGLALIYVGRVLYLLSRRSVTES